MFAKIWTTKLWPKGQTKRGAAVSGMMLLTIIIAFAVIVPTWRWSGIGPIKDLAGIFQSAITVFAIVVGGVFAWFKLQAFRDFEPHLTISHEVHHRIISDSYVHIDVTATLHNSSRVNIELGEADFRLQQVSPLSDSQVESLYAEVFAEEEHTHVQWPILSQVQRDWGKGDLIVEPGESHQESYDFIVSTDVESVSLYTYFYNPGYREGSHTAQGWRATTVYDIFNLGR